MTENQLDYKETSPVLVAASPAKNRGSCPLSTFYRRDAIVSQLFHHWQLLIHPRDQRNILADNLWDRRCNTRFCKKLGHLVSLFPKCPIHLKVPVDITTETGNRTTEVRFMKRIRGSVSQPRCGESG